MDPARIGRHPERKQAGRAKRFGYRDRTHAGRCLANGLTGLDTEPPGVVLGLPRGGVPVAAEVADRWGLRLDVFCVRKLGVPSQPELAFGAVASGGVRVLNRDVVQGAGLSEATIAKVTDAELGELERRERVYRQGRSPVPVRGLDVILVDDGLATGATAEAAITALRRGEPRSIVLAVPVAAPATIDRLAPLVDAVRCPLTPAAFTSVGAWYTDFSPTSDDDVRQLLTEHWLR